MAGRLNLSGIFTRLRTRSAQADEAARTVLEKVPSARRMPGAAR